MTIQNTENVSNFVPSENLDKGGTASIHLNLNDLAEIPINISAELGRRNMKIREILNLKKGSIIALNKQAGELADIFSNGVFIGRGEMIVLSDSLHVRIVEIEGYSKDEE